MGLETFAGNFGLDAITHSPWTSTVETIPQNTATRCGSLRESEIVSPRQGAREPDFKLNHHSSKEARYLSGSGPLEHTGVADGD